VETKDLMKIRTWFLETRPSFLLLSVVLAFLGTSIAFYDGFLHLSYAFLALLGLLLCHISVNVFNEYFDYRSGIDLRTKRTPFSGGSGILPARLLNPRHVFWFGVISFLLAVPIGIYFVVTVGWLLLSVILIGAICILLYTPFLTKLGWPEWAPGLGLGTLPILGFYFVQTSAYSLPAIIAAIPSGILVHNLLLLNEFPDAEADREAGRKTLPITIGKLKASILYSALTSIVYLWIISAAIAGLMPLFSLVALLTLPIAVRAIRGAVKYREEAGKLVSAMRDNVLVVLLTQVFLGVGYVIAAVL
jgi:1,4-dihydroxy-2-naphthoate octaprenyltransferase